MHAFSDTTLQIAGYKPDNYLFTYADYNTTAKGIKIEMLYRKVGTAIWYPAFNDQQKRVVLLDIKPNTEVSVRRLEFDVFVLHALSRLHLSSLSCFLEVIVFACVFVVQADIQSGYLFGNWSVRNFNTGSYEIVLHAVCSTLGHAFPGIDDTWSKPVVGSIQLVDTYRVIDSSYPAHFASAYTGEELSITFNVPVNCDKDNGFYWFNVLLTQNSDFEVPSTYYIVHCEGYKIYIMPNGDGV